MRFSVTFCALLLVTTTGIAQADSRENATAALSVDGGMWRAYGLFLEKEEDGKGVGIAGSTARYNNIGPSTDPKNPGHIATGDKGDVQLFVGTPDKNSQSVMASFLNSEGTTFATFVSLNPATNKLISVTDCSSLGLGEKMPRCLTITKKTCDAIFPQSHLVGQKLQKIKECGTLLEEMKSEAFSDPSVETANVARMKNIRPGLRLAANQSHPSDSIEILSYSYDRLAKAISLCHSPGPFERFEDPVKARNSQSQNKSPGSAEAATQ